MDETLYRDLLAHASRAARCLRSEPEDVVHEAYLRVIESGREPSPALLHRAVTSQNGSCAFSRERRDE